MSTTHDTDTPSTVPEEGIPQPLLRDPPPPPGWVDPVEGLDPEFGGQDGEDPPG